MRIGLLLHFARLPSVFFKGRGSLQSQIGSLLNTWHWVELKRQCGLCLGGSGGEGEVLSCESTSWRG